METKEKQCVCFVFASCLISSGPDIGYSGHEPSVSPSYAAWFLGADYIERHITLDRTMYGTYQAASLSEQGIRELTSLLSKFPKILGDGKKKISNEEKKLIPKFRYWK